MGRTAWISEYFVYKKKKFPESIFCVTYMDLQEKINQR